MEGTAEEVAERAVPFAVGDEVLVNVVEPHMYNVDDAVAKVDGYIISVTGGGSLVGSKVLVRIEEAGRTAARAVAIGEPVSNGAAVAAEADTRRSGRIQASAPWPQRWPAPFRCQAAASE